MTPKLVILLCTAFALAGQLAFGSLARNAAAQYVAAPTFEEVPARISGITWVHDNARSPERHLPETVGAGCAFFDYDNDGWLDIYLVNSGASDFFTPRTALKNALYRNNRDGTFTEIAEKAGVTGGSFGMGVAAGDYDADGWHDLYITNYGRNQLYHNNGNGTFSEVGEKAGVAVAGWSTCSVWFDYDNDGRLDLFVSSFADYSKSQSIFCADSRSGRRYYCIPRPFKARASYLFHNNGDGTFSDVSRPSGIASVPGKAFGAVATDINNDNRMDLFVANDTAPNFLFVNKGGGKFEELGLPAGVACSDAGAPRSGMGVDAADYDGDGWQDLFVANIDRELFSLYRNQRDLSFSDEPGEIGEATRWLSGWGLKFFDYDNDGDADLFLANGHPDDMVEAQNPQVKYKEPMLLFENTKGVFKNISAKSGAIFGNDYPARGMTVGDYDNDGDLDVLVSNSGAPPVLLRNEGGNRQNWVGLQLTGTKSNPAAIGAVISWQAAGMKWTRQKTGGGSYLASHDPREVLGIGRASKVESVEIRWPSGRVDKLVNLPTNVYTRVTEGQGSGVMTTQRPHALATSEGNRF